MLEQYRKDFPAEDKDLLSDNESIGKRKLLFIITGGAFALVFFLFLMGMFRSDEDTLAVKEIRGEMVSKENFLALEEKLISVQTRLDKLEQELEQKQLSLKETAKSALVQSQQEVEPMAIQAPPLSSPEEAVAMTNQALREMISQAALQTAVEPVVTIEKKEKTQKIAKAKTKKQAAADKLPLVTSPDSAVYVVQKGDTLSRISQRYYGTPNRWKAIYDANRDRIANMNQLKVGTALVIPKATK